MGKIIRLTESQLTNVVKRLLNEQDEKFYDPETSAYREPYNIYDDPYIDLDMPRRNKSTKNVSRVKDFEDFNNDEINMLEDAFGEGGLNMYNKGIYHTFDTGDVYINKYNDGNISYYEYLLDQTEYDGPRKILGKFKKLNNLIKKYGFYQNTKEERIKIERKRIEDERKSKYLSDFENRGKLNGIKQVGNIDLSQFGEPKKRPWNK